MMEYEGMIQSVLDNIDRRITENIRVEELARAANYSTYHFCRVFIALTGTPVMNYVIRRKLEYARYDLSQGKRIIDVAMDYGFDTHAGFTKAFKKCFGFLPSLCHLHITSSLPEKATADSVKINYGGFSMTPYIIVMPPFTVAGRMLRRKCASVKHHADMASAEISGLYAIFSTQPVPFEQHGRYAGVIQDTWNELFTKNGFQTPSSNTTKPVRIMNTTITVITDGILATSAKWIYVSPSVSARMRKKNLKKRESFFGRRK